MFSGVKMVSGGRPVKDRKYLSDNYWENKDRAEKDKYSTVYKHDVPQPKGKIFK